MTSFCTQAWAAVDPVRAATLELPFVVELGAGTLSAERFAYYLVQDARYLVEYARTLAAAAALADDPADLVFFAGSATTAIVVERALHEEYLARLPVPLGRPEMAAVPTSPTCAAYTSSLRAVAAAGSYPVLVAAVLPCFWLYEHVGSVLLAGQAAGSGPDDGGRAGAGADAAGPAANPYRRWIDTYADESFAASCATVRGIADRVAAETTPAVRDRMLAAFVRSAQYEWMFWDSAYALEQWPVAALPSAG